MSIKTNTKPNNEVVEVIGNTVTVDNGEEDKINLTKVDELRTTNELSTLREREREEVIASGKVEQLTSKIDLSDNNTIIEFGREPAEQMARVADQVLSKYDMSQVNGTTKLVDALLSVMKKIDIKEVESIDELMAKRQKRSMFDRFKESAQEKLNKLVAKYQAIGGDLDKICQQLTVYENQIKESNKDIARMYDLAIENYKTLTAYIIAGEQAVKEIEDYKNELNTQFAETGDTETQFRLQETQNQLVLMEQRVADLRGAEAVALQSVPTFKIQEYTNSNLQRKINSAFIVTVPAFKTALINSVISKQQALIAQGLSALDEATSTLIRKNAENAVSGLQMSQKLANSTSIKADDIEYSWNIIMNGIKQYKDMEKQYSEVRKQEARRIEAANTAYLNAVANGQGL